jgi:mannose-6-phosphate isomerase-like protein (cupin superfamily)
VNSNAWVRVLADFANHVAPRGIHYLRVSDTSSLKGRVEVDYVVVHKGDVIPLHFHEHSSALCLVVAGSGSIVLDGEIHEVSAGTVMSIPAGVSHEFRAIHEELVFVSVQHPPIEDDYVFPPVAYTPA